MWKLSLVMLAAAVTLAAQSPKYGVGRPATPEQIRDLGTAIAPDGSGLPEGSGTVAAGREVSRPSVRVATGKRQKELWDRRWSADKARSPRRSHLRRWEAFGPMRRRCGITSIGQCPSISPVR